MSAKRRGLGRGLGALIPTGPESNERPSSLGGVDGGDGVLGGVATAVEERPTEHDVHTDDSPAGGAAAGASVQDDDAPGASSTEAVAEESTSSDAAPVGVVSTSAVVPERTAEKKSAKNSGPRPSTVKWDSAIASGRLSVANDAEGGGATALDDTFFSRDQNESPVSRETPDLVPVPGARFAELPVSAIRPNTWQPRSVFDENDLDELVESIKEIGVLQPIVVRPDKEHPGEYELIMGERRWRATQAAELETIPAIVRETEDGDMLRDALLENLHRSALNPLEEAAAYRQLLDDFGCTHEELAARIARSRPQISNTLRLLRLPPLVQRRVAAGVLSAGHARALLGLSDGAEIERLAQRIVSEGLSVRATEEIVMLTESDGGSKTRKTPRAGTRSEAVDELATRLSDRFETRVKVALGKNKGRMTVEFASVEDLNRILNVMAPEERGLLKPPSDDCSRATDPRGTRPGLADGDEGRVDDAAIERRQVSTARHGCLGQQGHLRHARCDVHLKDLGHAGLVQDQIGAGEVAQVQCLVGTNGDVGDLERLLGREACRCEELGLAGYVPCRVVVSTGGVDLNGGERLRTVRTVEDADRDLDPGDRAFDQCRLTVGKALHHRARQVRCPGDKRDPER